MLQFACSNQHRSFNHSLIYFEKYETTLFIFTIYTCINKDYTSTYIATYIATCIATKHLNGKYHCKKSPKFFGWKIMGMKNWVSLVQFFLIDNFFKSNKKNLREYSTMNSMFWRGWNPSTISKTLDGIANLLMNVHTYEWKMIFIYILQISSMFHNFNPWLWM